MMIQEMQLQYAASLQPTYQDYEGRVNYGWHNGYIEAKEYVVPNVEEIG